MTSVSQRRLLKLSVGMVVAIAAAALLYLFTLTTSFETVRIWMSPLAALIGCLALLISLRRMMIHRRLSQFGAEAIYSVGSVLIAGAGFGFFYLLNPAWERVLRREIMNGGPCNAGLDALLSIVLSLLILFLANLTALVVFVKAGRATPSSSPAAPAPPG